VAACVALLGLRRIQDVGMSKDRAVRSDEELLVEIGSDAEALDELYRRCVARTVAFAVRCCVTTEEVHDLVAATWLEVIEASLRFDPDKGRALPWILGVMANLANDQRRRSAGEREALKRLAGRRTLEPDDIARLDEAMEAGRLSEPVLRELNALPSLEREAIQLVAFGHLNQEEAASALGVAPATFRMRIARARKRLRAAMESDEAGSEVLVR
jgi:RNA polymerase sigma factor (sigma-70 family)